MLSRPTFWQHESKSKLITLLKPLAFIWLYFTNKRIAKKSTKVNAYVICVGNILLGGTGKTPVAIAIANHLQAKGKKVAFVSKGYGSKNTNTIIKVESHHSHLDVGDEALILQQYAPIWIGNNRLKAAELAAETGAEIIIMDDGFQYPYLNKDKSILVVEGNYGFGNNHIFPSGPLREPINQAVKRASSIITIGEKSTHLQEILNVLNIQSYSASINVINPQTFQNKNVVAFCGIGNPEKFFASLKTCHANILKTFPFPDHHNFTELELEKMLSTAKLLNATLVTTEKDYARLKNSKYKNNILTLRIELKIHNIDALI